MRSLRWHANERLNAGQVERGVVFQSDGLRAFPTNSFPIPESSASASRLEVRPTAKRYACSVAHRAKRAWPKTSAARFPGYPDPTALVIVNSSNAVARDTKWMVVLWNIDHPPAANSNLFLDRLKPYTESTPRQR